MIKKQQILISKLESHFQTQECGHPTLMADSYRRVDVKLRRARAYKRLSVIMKFVRNMISLTKIDVKHSSCNFLLYKHKRWYVIK